MPARGTPPNDRPGRLRLAPERLKDLGRGLLDLVFSPVCLGCDGALPPGGPHRLVCGACRSRLRALPPPCCPRCGAPLPRTGRAPGHTCGECATWPASLRYARSAVWLHDPADRLVHQLKYRGWRALAEPLGAYMARLVLPVETRREAHVVVPVPTTPTRRRERGYNQAEQLARVLAERTGRRLCVALERRDRAGSQTALQPLERRSNVAGMFRAAPGEMAALRGAHVVLVDDVLTTGATVAECTRALVGAGVRCVSAVTFARALDARRFV